MDWSLPGSTLPHYLSALQHWTSLSPLDISTTEHHFPIGSAILFFLELVIVLHCSPVAYWTPSNLKGSSSGTISFCLFILLMGFSRHEYWTGLPFPPPLVHILSELFTTTCSSWVTLHNMACSFIELCKPLCHDKAVICEGKIKYTPIFKKVQNAWTVSGFTLSNNQTSGFSQLVNWAT